MKRITLFFLLVVIALLTIFVSCSSDKPPSSTESSEQNRVENEETPLKAALKIAGTDIANYKIVYARSEYHRTGRNFTTEYDFYKLIAQRVQADLYDISGVMLEIALDTSTEEGEYEILVGPTNRTQSDAYDTMDVYKYQNTVTSNKLVLGGGYVNTALTGDLKTGYSWASTYHSWDYILDYIREGVNAGKSEIDFADGFSQSGKCNLITVACIGDSITEGYLSTDWNYCSYPAVLQRILWQDYVVINYGNSGKTMRDDLGARYQNTPQYNAAVKNASKFDLALIMLGTNDSHNDPHFSAADNQAFNDSALSLVSALTKKNSDLKITVMNCPVYYGTGTSGSLHVRNLQAKLVGILRDKGHDVSYFDMYSFTKTELTETRFPDDLHPNDEGYALMGHRLAEVVPAIMDGTWDEEPKVSESVTPDVPTVPVPEGSVNILGGKIEERCSMETESDSYLSWYMGGTPYVFMDLDLFEGYKITNLEVPVASCSVGDVLTVSVIKYSHPRVTETLKTYKLSVSYDADWNLARFGELEILVPEGYTLAFGSPGDTLKMLYIGKKIAGYEFYGSGGNSVNDNAALPFNVYGVVYDGPWDDIPEGGNNSNIPDVPVPEGSVNILGGKIEERCSMESEGNLYLKWYMGGTPYVFMDLDLFGGYKITNLEVPVSSCRVGDTLTVSVIKYSHPRVTETLKTYTLTVTYDADWNIARFGNLDIEVPEGYTLAFGSPGDTLRMLYIGKKIAGYEFYGSGGNSVNDNAALPFNVYGTLLNGN